MNPTYSIINVSSENIFIKIKIAIIPQNELNVQLTFRIRFHTARAKLHIRFNMNN